ncbi:MAG: hypothetical protein E5Y10_24510 [Mesorhizobium sp.]|nr:MAG: hypothetical protein E5Y10_24510 [Mesorhizobium sp.]
MLRKGASYSRIARFFGSTTTTVHCWLDPAYAAQCRERVNATRRNKSKEQRKKTPHQVWKPSWQDVEARLAAIPADTRNLTQRICGDPIPGDPRRHWRPA